MISKLIILTVLSHFCPNTISYNKLNKINIDNKKILDGDINIYNTLGQVDYRGELLPNLNEIDFSSGIYIVNILQNNIHYRKKVIVYGN